MKKTQKYPVNKKQARKAVGYLSYLENNVISQQRSTSCDVHGRQFLCNHYAGQYVSVVDFDIIMAVDAVAKRTRSGMIVFTTNSRYANNIS
ncbi:hypothetical protein SAMN06309944_0983 [Micrococcales bacterium KH10]|nr:hypothetical protein SAMN06309944_0983 [Micrococcales bacterium KH10]